MGLKGDAPWALGVMWFLAGVVFFFLILRLYTRIVCLASYGIDDHVYIVAFIFLVIFNVFTTLAGHYGFGQTMEEIGSIESAVQATLVCQVRVSQPSLPWRGQKQLTAFATNNSMNVRLKLEFISAALGCLGAK